MSERKRRPEIPIGMKVEIQEHTQPGGSLHPCTGTVGVIIEMNPETYAPTKYQCTKCDKVGVIPISGK